MNIQTLTACYNCYFKGGANDNFISGIWIGSAEQIDRLFISCTFNGVEATFINCTFIDCFNPPEGENCTYIELPHYQRLILNKRENKELNSKWLPLSV